MSPVKTNPVTRRDFVKGAVAGTAAAPFGLLSRRALAAQTPLRILKWAHFVPEFDTWFAGVARDWGREHHTKVIIDTVPVERIGTAAQAEIRAGKGHDICIFPWPPAEYYRHTIDHTEVYQRAAMKYGAIPQLAYRSTFNLKNKQHFAFADFWMPSPVHFFQDYWAQVGMPLGPVHYTALRVGSRKIREQLGIPLGLAFSPTLEGNVTLHTLFYSHRAWILDGRGGVLFNKDGFAWQTLKYLEVLFKESGTPEQLTWESGGNVRAMLARKTSSSSNAISLLRAAEKQDPAVAGKIRLQPPLLGTAGMGVTALPHVTNCSAVWSFAHNQDSARQFPADLPDLSRLGYEKSLGCNFPIYPKTVPDLIVRLSNDARADPPYKYVELKDALHWTPNLGVPGFATPEYMEIFNSSLLPRMVRSVLRGERDAADAAGIAASEIQRIVTRWSQV
jgi:ABC-type glycerol-3-phosphate transport system substrate-binding protein